MTTESKRAHTPGPWSVDRLGKVRCQVDGGRGFIADPGDGRYYNSIPRDAEISLANARLIAAAPDLLTALEGLVAYADHYTTTDHGDCTCPHCVARAAIAKAKGETE